MRRHQHSLPLLFPGRWTAFASLLLIIGMVGCSSFQAHQLAKRLAAGDTAGVAAQPVDCTAGSTGCARLHLLKGAACLEMAATRSDALDFYTCAAEQLRTGMVLHPAWSDTDHQMVYQQRLCEALEQLHRLAPDEETLEHFEQAAETLYRLAPESLAAVYFLSSLRLQEAAPLLATLDAGNRLPVCSRLKRALNRLLAVMSGDPERQPGWDQFADKYEQLAFHLGLAIRTAGCR